MSSQGSPWDSALWKLRPLDSQILRLDEPGMMGKNMDFIQFPAQTISLPKVSLGKPLLRLSEPQFPHCEVGTISLLFQGALGENQNKIL